MLIERLVWPHGKVCAAMLSVNLDAEFFGRIYYPDVDVDSGDILSLGRTGMNFGLRRQSDLLYSRRGGAALSRTGGGNCRARSRNRLPRRPA